MRCSIPASRTKASHDHEEGPTNPPLAKHGGPPWPALSEPNAQHLCATRDHKQVWTYLQWLVPFAMYIYIYNYTELLPEPLYRALSAHVRANEIMRCLDGVDESL